MLLCDGGTTYTKIFDTDNQNLSIVKTKDIVKNKNRHFKYATGHSSKEHCDKYVNELIALAYGGLGEIVEDNFTLVDIGSRDMKLVVFQNRTAQVMDWNSSCGGNMGFTTEILGQYYNVDYDTLPPQDKSVPLACGLLGIERIFDLINKGTDPDIALAYFIRGLAKASFNFAKKPDKLYISGGFSNNICFLKTLESFCQVVVKGQDLLIKGLLALAQNNIHHDNFIQSIKS